MVRPSHSLIMLAACFAAFGTTGCAVSNLQSVLTASTASASGSSGMTVHSEGPVEIYSRIARGALGCWFRNDGAFKKSYIFNAEVASNTEAAEIVIHERDANAPSPRSLRAMRIAITPTGQGSQVAVENLKFPEPVGREMTDEIARWAEGQQSCKSPGGPTLTSADPAVANAGGGAAPSIAPPAGIVPVNKR
jgi:hypothetical protein